MNRNQCILLDLLVELLDTKQIGDPQANYINLEEIYTIAYTQGLSTVIFPVLDKVFKDRNMFKEIVDSWNNMVWKTSAYNLILLSQIDCIVKLFYKENISPIIVKGLAIARLYKAPELRRMSDLDILVRDYEWDKSKQILEKMGYIQCEEEDYNPLHVSFQKKGFISVELHRQLIHFGYLGRRNTENWYRHIWDNKKKITLENLEFFAMCEEDELINQITHFAAHFVYIGVRLKYLFEIALIIKSAEGKLNWSYIEYTLKTIGFLKFGKLLFSACRTFFKVNIPEELSNVRRTVQEEFMSDLLNYFSFEETKEDFKGWIHVVGRFKWILRSAIFQPIAWAVEARTQYKLHKLRLSFAIRNSIRNIKVMNKKMKIIRKFGLVEGGFS